MGRGLLAAIVVGLVLAVPLHAEQRPLPASMKCPASLSPADGTYSLTASEQQTLIYNLDSYHVACVWQLSGKSISFSVNWSESTKYAWANCGRQYNDGSNFSSRTKRANAVLSINQALNTPGGQSQQAAVLTVLERFLDAAEVRASPCKEETVEPSKPAQPTLQRWSVSLGHGSVFRRGFALASFRGSGTFRLSAQKKPTAATGRIRIVEIDSESNRRVGIDLRVTGASGYRRSNSVERITLHVRVTNLDSGDEKCLDRDAGTVGLVDGYGIVEDHLTVSGICSYRGSTDDVKVTIR